MATTLVDYLAGQLRKEVDRGDAAYLSGDRHAENACAFRAQGYRHSLGAAMLDVRGRRHYTDAECFQAVAESYPELCYPEGKNEDPLRPEFRADYAGPRGA